jgi:hypothetical protein
MSRTSPPVVLSEAELSRLGQWIRAGSTPQQVVLRARIIRDAAAGQTDKMIAATLAVRRETAALWRRRVREQGIGRVWEIAPGRCGTYTHDYQRHGITTLFAALHVVEGRVIG